MYAGGLNTESAQDLRHLADVPERIGDVADHHLGAEFPAGTLALQQVAEGGFRADQELVGQDVPGSDEDTPIADVLAQVGFASGAHEQVIVQDDGLTVEHKVCVAFIMLQNVQQAVNQVDKFQAKLLEGEIPFPVPVGVRYKV